MIARIAGGLGPDRPATLIAGSRGILGTNLEYLDELAQRLDELDVPDPGFFELYARARAIASASETAKSPARPGISG
ncbi:MAG: gamma-glutamylcyclotransferase [Cucumibacter sp.]